MVNSKQHLTEEGLLKIVGIRYSINKGLDEELTKYFPNITQVHRPKLELSANIDPNWLAGFTEAEGCFYVGIVRNKAYKLGEGVALYFTITQHSRDQQMMSRLVDYLGCGTIQESSSKPITRLVVTKFTDIEEKIIPFFDRYPLHGSKAKDFADFKRVAEIVKNKGHLTASGLSQIKDIKSGMNRGTSLD